MREIERKFLIEKLSDIPYYFRKSSITQAYISDSPEVRIRKIDDLYYRTEKSDGNIVREETEVRITAHEYDLLLQNAIGIAIKKERFYILLSEKLTAEVDIYSAPLFPLMTVEVEFGSLEEAMKFEAPEWFGREITKDKEYKNKNLALHGLPKSFEGEKYE